MMKSRAHSRLRPAGSALLLLLACSTATHAAELTQSSDRRMTGVELPARAWQHYALNCQGCHRPDGAGSERTAPPLAGLVATFTRVEGGREYLVQVPGVATSPVSDAELAELLNWMLWRFDGKNVSDDFEPYSGTEVGLLRKTPLRTEASGLRKLLLEKAGVATE